MMNARKTFILSDTSYPDVAQLFLRVGFGGMMLLHGLGKLMDLLNGKTAFFESFDPFGIGGVAMLTLAVVAEFGCAILLIVGLFTRLSLIPLVVTMAIAFLVFHAQDPLMDKELPLLYLVDFVGLFLLGPGKYSLDYILQRKNELDD